MKRFITIEILLKMWTQLTQSLTELKEKHSIDIKLINDSFENKTKGFSMICLKMSYSCNKKLFSELNRLIKEIKKCNKEKKKLLLELETVEKAIIKANSNIAKAEEKCLEIQECEP